MSNKIITKSPIAVEAKTPVVIREASTDDGDAIRRLAQRDSARLPTGPMLVAEADGAIRAARSLTDDAVIADPFQRTAEIVALLELRAGQVRRSRTSPLRVVARTPSTPRALRQAA